MTTLPPPALRITVTRGARELTVDVAGDLDYDTVDHLVETVSEQLARHPEVRGVRLDFAELSWIDSVGLSALLMIHRRTRAVGGVLYLENRPALLERLLRQTGTLGHLTARPGRDEGATGANVT
ncbi:anti-sigma factor antagonist [Streptomyces sp. SID486]|uniref:STAS domain-containing protein n=1 Tax=unclassified Streptomyces TaxID=2593676 RepID=UPI0013688BF6|nr:MULTISPECIES: STAS domain-containing protein [unclassified Streptomyces]MYW19050.1 anti-sigma factor antagonist [Streptomyces sp. SID2955]MYW46699.1 anti-sigma factor antagonist [Streptomyces sp. SID161]MYX94383.1 anti-sigma factor antagonist [Streptomyces sp. SID486]